MMTDDDERRPARTLPTDGDDDGLDERQSWVLVGAIAFAGIVAPAIVYLWPPSFLGFKNAYMAAAMVPAIVLAVAAIWSAKAARS